MLWWKLEMVRASLFRARDQVHLRDFVWTLIRTDFKARYHGALSGFLWALLKPIAMFVVLFAVFSFVFRERLYMLNLLVGLLLWDTFAAGTRVGMGALADKAYLLTSASFPRAIVVATSLANTVLTQLIFMVAIVVLVAMRGANPTVAGVGLFVVYNVLLFFIVLGFSLATSVWYLKYRDLNQVWDVALQAGFFVAPVVFPLATLPERFHFYLYLWPPTSVIQFSRAVLVEHQVPTLKAHALLVAAAVLSFAVGAAIFHKYSPRAIERL
jgi:lipopolysaccharide transport system permease protein